MTPWYLTCWSPFLAHYQKVRSLFHDQVVTPWERPGLDFVPNKLLKANPVHWDVIQGPVFLCDQPFMKDPPIWKHSIIVPIFKKDSSQSHCSISLLSSGAKLYTSYPYLKLEEWITSNNIRRWEQIGFRKGFETQDHCLILTHLDEKYTSPLRGRLYVAFIDLKRAFDTIPRSSLWGNWNVPQLTKNCSG